MKVTLRPNLNTGKRCKDTGRYLTLPQTTVHSKRLGKKSESVLSCTIKCTGVVVRPAGQKLAQKEGKKTVHAGVIGTPCDYIPVDPSVHPRVRYNPKTDTHFHVNGEKYEGGGYVTAIGHEYYLVG